MSAHQSNHGSGRLLYPAAFIASHTPLWIVLGLRMEPTWLVTTVLLLPPLSLGLFTLLLRLNREPEERQGWHSITEVRLPPRPSVAYLLVPWVGLVLPTDPTLNQLLVLLALLCFTGATFARLGLSQALLPLMLLGYRMAIITDEWNFERTLLARGSGTIEEGMRIATSRLTNEVLILERVYSEDVADSPR